MLYRQVRTALESHRRSGTTQAIAKAAAMYANERLHTIILCASQHDVEHVRSLLPLSARQYVHVLTPGDPSFRAIHCPIFIDNTVLLRLCEEVAATAYRVESEVREFMGWG